MHFPTLQPTARLQRLMHTQAVAASRATPAPHSSPLATQTSRHARRRPASGCLATIGVRACGALPPRSRGFRVQRERGKAAAAQEGGLVKCLLWRASLTPSFRSCRPWASRVQASFFASQDMRGWVRRLPAGDKRTAPQVMRCEAPVSWPRPSWRSASTGGSSPPRDPAHVLDCNNKFRALILAQIARQCSDLRGVELTFSNSY